MSDRSALIKEVKSKIGRYCALAERSKRQVSDKLSKWGLSASESESIIEMLLSDGFLDELRFSRAFVHDKFAFNKWGRIKISNELKLKHQIPQDIIQIALSRIEQEEYLRVMESIGRKKYVQLSNEHPLQLQKKIASHLISKGFEPSTVFPLVKEIVNNPT